MPNKKRSLPSSKSKDAAQQYEDAYKELFKPAIGSVMGTGLQSFQIFTTVNYSIPTFASDRTIQNQA